MSILKLKICGASIALFSLILPVNATFACVPSDTGKSCMPHQCSTVCCHGYACHNKIKQKGCFCKHAKGYKPKTNPKR